MQRLKPDRKKGMGKSRSLKKLAMSSEILTFKSFFQVILFSNSSIINPIVNEIFQHYVAQKRKSHHVRQSTQNDFASGR